MGSSGSSGSTASSSLTASQRAELYDAAMNRLGQTIPANPYRAPEYVSQGGAKTLSQGDYSRLEDSLLGSRNAQLDRAKSLDTEKLNQSMADRGLYTSGVALAAQNDLNETYAPQYLQAAADATAQRYGLQANENNMVNDYNTKADAAANTFNTNKANAIYSNSWDIPNYLKDVWSGTQGSYSISNNGSSGWSI